MQLQSFNWVSGHGILFYYSLLQITRTLDNSNLLLTQTNFNLPSGHFLYNFALDNSPNNWKLFQFPFKVRVIGSRLYIT